MFNAKILLSRYLFVMLVVGFLYSYANDVENNNSNTSYNKTDSVISKFAKQCIANSIVELDEYLKNSLSKAQNKDISAQQFSDVIEEIVIKATNKNCSDSCVNNALDNSVMNDIQACLAIDYNEQDCPYSMPFFFNNTVLSKYIESLDGNYNHKARANPLQLIKCSELMVTMLNEKLNNDEYYPSTKNIKKSDIKKLKKLKKECKKVIGFFQENDYLKSLTKLYQKYALELCNEIKVEQSKYNQEEALKLRKKHIEFFEAECVQLELMPNLFDCKQCIQKIRETINNVKSGKYNATRATLLYKNDFNTPEIFEILENGNSLEKILNPKENFNKIWQEYSAIIHEKWLDEYLNAALLDLDASVGPAHCLSFLLYPENMNGNLPILLLPKEKLPIDQIFLQEEIYGTLRIRNEYAVNGSMFCIYSYLVDPTMQVKIKILELCKPNDCMVSAVPFYSLNEAINHCYYGGRYPLKSDVLYAKQNQSFRWTLGHYPPMKHYPAERDNFVSTAHIIKHNNETMQKNLQDFKRKKRLEFNQTVKNLLLSPSTRLNQLVQNFDVHFKLLNNLVHSLYYDFLNGESTVVHEHCSVLFNNDSYNLKNHEALIHYLNSYSDENSLESLQGNYLPYYLERASRNIVQAINNLRDSKIKPCFKRIEDVINALDLLIDVYKKRQIISPGLFDCPDQKISSKVSLLMEKNEVLANEVLKLQERVLLMQKQLDNLTIFSKFEA